MFFRKKNRSPERFYLFPGQGGKNFHRKQQRIMRWTVVVALIAAAVLAAALWMLDRAQP